MVLAGLPRAVLLRGGRHAPFVPNRILLKVLIPVAPGPTGSMRVSLLIVLAARAVRRVDRLFAKGQGIARHFVPISQVAARPFARTVRIVVQLSPIFHLKRVKPFQPRRTLRLNVLPIVQIVPVGRLSVKGQGVVRRSVRIGRVAVHLFVPISLGDVLLSDPTVRIVVQPSPALHPKKVKPFQLHRALRLNVPLIVRTVPPVGPRSEKILEVGHPFVPIGRMAAHPIDRTDQVRAQAPGPTGQRLPGQKRFSFRRPA